MAFLLSILARFLPRVSAASLPGVICGDIPGCDQEADNVLLNALPVAVEKIGDLAAAGSVLGVVISGVYILTSLGDQSKVTKGRQGILYSLGGLTLALSAQSLVSFVIGEQWVSEGDLIPSLFASFVRIAVALSQTALVMVILWAGFSMVMASGKPDEFKKASEMIKWAIVGSVVIGLGKAIVAGLFTLGITLDVS